jgi:hypothetical protein
VNEIDSIPVDDEIDAIPVVEPEPRELKASREPISPTEAFFTRAGRAVSLGLTEPVSAAITAGVLDKVPGKEEPSFKERYEFARQLQRERQGRIEKEQPVAAGLGTTAGTITGFIPSVVPRAAGAGVFAAESLLGRALTPAGGAVARGIEGATGLPLGRIGRGVVQGAVEGAVPGAIYESATNGLDSAAKGAAVGAAAGGLGRGAISSLEAGIGAARRSVGRSGSDLAEVGAGDIERARRETLADIREPQAKLEQKIAGVAAIETRAAEKAANQAAKAQVKTENQIARLAAVLPEERAAELRALNADLAKINADMEGLDRSARAASAQMHQEAFTRASNFLSFAERTGEPVPPEFLEQYKYLGSSLGKWNESKMQSLQKYMENKQAWWDEYTAGKRVPLAQQQQALAEKIAAYEDLSPEDALSKAREIITKKNAMALSPQQISNIYAEKGLSLPVEDATRYTASQPVYASFSTGRAATATEEARRKAQLAFEQARTPSLMTEAPVAPSPEELAEFVRREAAGRRQVKGLSAPEIGVIPGEAERAIPTESRRAAYGGLLAREGVGLTPRIPGVSAVRGLILQNAAIDPAQASQFLALEPRSNRFKYPEQAFALLRDFESVIANDEKALAKFGPVVNRLGIAGALRTLLSTPTGAADLAASVSKE